MIGMFDSKESYRANSESTAQHSIFMTLRSSLEEDSIWHDVEHLLSLGESDH